VSKCSDEQIRRLCQSFLETMQVEDIAFLEDFSYEETYDYGNCCPLWSYGKGLT